MEEKKRYDLQKIQTKLNKHIDEDRFIHTLGVMYTSASLAMAHGCSMDDAQVAGLLHDCAKCIPNDKKLKICKKNQIEISSVEYENPILLHAKLGAFIAETKYDISDSDILQAIKYHTTGRAGMSILEKIVFIADYIEPKRYKAKNLAEIRKMAFIDLDECTYMILRDTLTYLKNNPKAVDPTTSDAYDFYQEIHNQKSED